MAAANASTQKCVSPQARPDGSTGAKPARGAEPSPMAQLAETVARVQARLNSNPATRPAPNGNQTPKAKRAPISTVSQAKNYLRSTRPRSPKFLRSTPALQRHSRKCAICRHPEREAIEDLFIHWHSPQAIANIFHDYDSINWHSIYRHAYALGLDAVRRRNLGFVFEHVLDNAADATPTAAGVVAAARALGGCVSADGRWLDPVKRVMLTTIVRKEDPSATTSTDPDSTQSSGDSVPSHESTSPVGARFQPCREQAPMQAALAAEVQSENVLGPGAVRAASRENRLPHNSHATKEKRIPNR